MPVQRFASVIGLRPEKQEDYLELHREVWPGVLEALKRAHVSNYSIFLREGILFSYLEYDGESFATDMAALAEDESTQAWWKLTDPCQQRLDTAEADEWWAPVEEVFHLD